MAGGDVKWTYGLFAIKALSKTNTAITKGDVVYFDTDGWAPAVQGAGPGATGSYGVMISATVAAVAGVQSDITVLLRGEVEINKITGALSQGEPVGLSATSGSVGSWSIADVGASPSQTSINDAITDATEKVGTVLEDAASGDATVKTLVGW